MTDKNDANQTTSTGNAAIGTQTNASADIERDDIAKARPNSQLVSNEAQPVSQREPADTHKIENETTGPSVSKKMGNKNALTYGLFSKDFIAPGERKEDFEKLLKDYRDEWKPNGCSEEQAVLKLAHYTLIEERLVKGERLRLLKSTIPEELKTEGLTWEDMARHQSLVPEHASGALLSAKRLIDKLDEVFELIRERPYWTDTSDGKTVQMELSILKNNVSSLTEETRSVVEDVHRLAQIVQELASRFDQAYQPDEIEKNLDRMAKIDRCKEKVLRFLTAVKEYKRAAGLGAPSAPVLEAPSVVPDGKSFENALPQDTAPKDNDSTHRQSVARAALEDRNAEEPKAD